MITAGVGGHGIDFNGVQNSVIDSCTVVNAFANGIFLEGSHHNIVMNNTIADTQTQHAIAVQNSNDNVIVGNRISASAFDGIIVNSAPELTGRAAHVTASSATRSPATRPTGFSSTMPAGSTTWA